MTMDSSKRHLVADVVLTATVVGVGFATVNPVLIGIVGGIGVNWASDLTRAGWSETRSRLFGPAGLGNRDLQKALARAFEQAIGKLEKAWWQTPAGSNMQRTKPTDAKAATGMFKMLRQDTASFCSPDSLGRLAGNEQIQQLLYGDEVKVRRGFSASLANYLHGQDPQLVEFLDRSLVNEVAVCFGEELKADRPDSNRAWRAFQRWLLEGLQAGLDNVDKRVEAIHANQ